MIFIYGLQQTKYIMHLKQNKLASLYFLSGDETLLVEEARDKIILNAKALGFATHHLLTINSANDWLNFADAIQSMNLFDEKKIIDVRNPSTKFDNKTQEMLTAYVSSPSTDTLVIISCQKLTATQKKTKWFQVIETHAVVNIIWPLKKQELPRWISQRLQQYRLSASPEISHLLIELTEGNLLATNQAIQKLSLLFPKQSINAAQLASVVHNCSEFNVFDLSNYMLAGKTDRVIHIMTSIQHKEAESTLVLWALTRDIRLLYTLRHRKDRLEPVISLLSKEWDPRKTLLQQAVQRLSLTRLSHLLTLAHEADLTIKGARAGNPWIYLTDIATQLSEGSSS